MIPSVSVNWKRVLLFLYTNYLAMAMTVLYECLVPSATISGLILSGEVQWLFIMVMRDIDIHT